MLNLKRLVPVIILSVLTANPVFPQEAAAVWGRLYNRSRSLEQKYQVMLNIVELKDRNLIPVISNALEELIKENKNITGTNERVLFNNLLKIMVMELGNLKALESAPWVYTVFQENPDPLVRGEALVALGKMGAKEYAEPIARFLRNLNFNVAPSQQRRDNEILAYSAVIALERLKDPLGFEPIFFASTGWYSGTSQVKERARSALVALVEDPTEELINIMRNNSSFTVKLAALEAGVISRAPSESKELLGIAALREGLAYQTKDLRELNTLSRLRTLAASLIKSTSLTRSEAVPLLEQMLYIDYDVNEKITALEALATSELEDPVLALVKFLRYQNERQASGLTTQDNRVIISTLRAIGSLGNKAATEELIMVRHSNWSGTVVREAAAALEKLQ